VFSTAWSSSPFNAAYWAARFRNGTCIMDASNPFLIRLDQIDKRADVIAIGQAGLFLAGLEAGAGLVVVVAAIENEVAERGFFGVGLADVLADPIADLAVGNRLADDVDE